MAALLHLVRDVVPIKQLTILFTATRHHAEFLYNLLIKEGVDAACVFGSMDQVRVAGIQLLKRSRVEMGTGGTSECCYKCACVFYGGGLYGFMV